MITRRRWLMTGAASAGALSLSGCDALSRSPTFRKILGAGEGLTEAVQRSLMFGRPLAREYAESDLSRVFKANGTKDPGTDAYNAMVANRFADWRLKIYGLVDSPRALSLADLRALPARTQITRHDCVEGWSAIGKWTGAQLGPLLKAIGLKPNARFAVFHCADDLDGSSDGSGRYYESVDLVDAFHPQTILAYEMNGKPLEVAHGAPLRLRVERALGYKHAKYLMGIEFAERLDGFGRGKGGYWEDRGYEWYAGI
ncbi:MAG: molybdopterin-dependent oxidoreductase [Alphaproteobacteria bacterium]|nr:molybdopterin-dependent oxidoreductase [Alphaproteobacteria bacterium]